jgi:hypothetical protein
MTQQYTAWLITQYKSLLMNAAAEQQSIAEINDPCVTVVQCPYTCGAG